MGMKPDYPATGLIEAFCHRLGYQVAVAGDGFDARSLARRLVPERWRIAISARMSREAQERALADQFRNATDWSRTTAFSVPTLYGAFLRVNLRGREPQGIVDPAGYEAVLAQLEDDLAQLVDPITGEPAIETAVRTVDLYGGGPPTSLPDLFVEIEPTEHFRAELVHPGARLTQVPPAYFRDTHHSPVGWLAAAGPSIAPARQARTRRRPRPGSHLPHTARGAGAGGASKSAPDRPGRQLIGTTGDLELLRPSTKKTGHTSGRHGDRNPRVDGE